MPKGIIRAYEYLIQVSSEDEARELEAQYEHYNNIGGNYEGYECLLETVQMVGKTGMGIYDLFP